jgi:phage terminase large subunit-like protein
MQNPFPKNKYPNCHDGHNYALDIVSGKIVANKWIIGACQRYLSDLKRIDEDKDCPFYFRPEQAEKFLRIVQKFDHAVGHWETAKIIYEPWQKFIWMNIKGFYSHKTKMIRFRTAHIDVARGNAKSTMASQAALYELCCDNPNGNRIYCAATSRDQAKEVLNGSQIMARKNESFLKHFNVDVRAHEILHHDSNSYMKAISAQANSLDGKIGQLVITDELHAMQRKTFEVLDSGQSKRRDSLLLSITTAGYENAGVGASQRKYAQKVALGEIEDETFFSMVYCLDEEEHDIWNPDNWIMANPNFGISVDPDNFAAKAKKAKENPEDAANFKIKHLNIYLGSLNQFFDVVKWRKNKNQNLDLKKFYGKTCMVGLDLASKIDITSICLVFNENNKYQFFWWNFIPEKRLEETKNRNYYKYVEQGDLIVTPGEVINYNKIQDKILELSKLVKFRDVMFDPWSAQQMHNNLVAEGIEMVEFRQNTGNYSEPTKKLQELMFDNTLEHNTGEMLEWCVGNVVCKYDANENVFPRKDHESFKIDPIIAAIMGLAGWVAEDDSDASIYGKRDMVII